MYSSLIVHHNMCMKCAEDPFNMGMFFDWKCPSIRVHLTTPITHIQAFHTGVTLPPPEGWGGCYPHRRPQHVAGHIILSGQITQALLGTEGNLPQSNIFVYYSRSQNVGWRRTNLAFNPIYVLYKSVTSVHLNN